jgi:hypothetical protein
MRSIPEVDLIKLFWHKFTHTFCRLHNYINIIIIFVLKKDKAFKKVTKFMPKSYIRLTPEVNLINFFGINLLTLFVN